MWKCNERRRACARHEDHISSISYMRVFLDNIAMLGKLHQFTSQFFSLICTNRNIVTDSFGNSVYAIEDTEWKKTGIASVFWSFACLFIQWHFHVISCSVFRAFMFFKAIFPLDENGFMQNSHVFTSLSFMCHCQTVAYTVICIRISHMLRIQVLLFHMSSTLNSSPRAHLNLPISTRKRLLSDAAWIDFLKTLPHFRVFVDSSYDGWKLRGKAEQLIF